MTEKWLISGGAGSLGRHLIKELIKPEFNDKVAVIRVLDNNENGLAKLNLYVKDPRIRLFLGDIRDKERITKASENIDVFIMAAALKHVDLCEANPFENLQTNVIGTQYCIDAALINNIAKVVYVSSDKACNPVSCYGKAKSLSESLILDAENYKGDRRTIFTVVRPPNYLFSDGSVWDTWSYQKENNLPLTVTSSSATRYFMNLDEIVAFLLKTVEMMKGGEIFVPKNPELHKIIDLAKQISNNIIITGLRKGERLHEKLIDETEFEKAKEVDGMWVIEQ